MINGLVTHILGISHYIMDYGRYLHFRILEFPLTI